MNALGKALVAEFIGTFALVLIGCGAATVAGPITFNQPTTIGALATVALAFGLTIMIFAAAYGHISGTHINPSVTLGLLVAGKIKTSDAIAYIYRAVAWRHRRWLRTALRLRQGGQQPGSARN